MLGRRYTGEPIGDICRALREANPGWMVRGAVLAKTERAEAWSDGVSNAHVPSALSRAWAEGWARNPWETHGGRGE